MFDRLKGALANRTEADLDKKQDPVLDDGKPESRTFGGRRFDSGLPPFQPQPGGFGRRAVPVGGTATPPGPEARPAASPSARKEQGASGTSASGTSASGTGAGPVLGDIPTRLANWLMRELKDERGVHCETMLTSVGALAGYAAQQALWEGMVKPGKMAIREAFQVVEGPSGENFFFGEALDTLLTSMEPKNPSIWKIVAGGTLSLGGEHLPDMGNLLRHCAATAGTSQFGLPRLPDDHLPTMLPRDALERLWPGARLLLGLAEPLTWPLHMAHAAQKLMQAMKGSIAPDLAVRLVMEAAVPMSRIDPTTVPND
jgi:hypothetical protein